MDQLSDITKDIQTLPEFQVIAKAPKFTRKQKLIALAIGAGILLFLSKNK